MSSNTISSDTISSGTKTIENNTGTMMGRMENFALKYNLDEEGKAELMKLLNESLIVISEGILNMNMGKKEGKKESKKDGKKEVITGIKKYKSKKAEEYAKEHGIDIDDFEMLEISKKDVDTKIRDNTKNMKEYKVDKVDNIDNKKDEVKNNFKVICSGINKKGEPCKSTGTICQEGAKNKYCFRHAEDWKSFECDSDSSSEDDEREEELVEEPVVE